MVGKASKPSKGRSASRRASASKAKRRARRRSKSRTGRDYQHLAGDIKRVYGQIVPQWLAYMAHLKRTYPYLFSLAMRTNPFDASATPVLA